MIIFYVEQIIINSSFLDKFLRKEIILPDIRELKMTAGK